MEKEGYGHVWPVDLPTDVYAEGPCSELFAHKVVNCGDDTAKDIIEFLIPNVVDSEVTEI